MSFMNSSWLASTMASLPHLLLRYSLHQSPNENLIHFVDTLTAHIVHPIRRRCLPLGLRDPWTPLRPRPRLLHRLSQFLRLDIRSRLHRVHSFECSCANVRSLPPRPCHQAMARLRRFHSHHLVLLRTCSIWEPLIAGAESDRIISGYSRWNYNHHRSRSDAESTCKQFGSMG